MDKLSELYLRRKICLGIIKAVSAMDDPRKPDALKEYNRQLAEIDRKITEITGTPPPIVIGLKEAHLISKVPK